MFTVQFHVKSALSKPKSCHKGLSDNLQGHCFFFFNLYRSHTLQTRLVFLIGTQLGSSGVLW